MKINKDQLCILECRLGMTASQVAVKAGLKPQSYSAAKTRGSCAPTTIYKIASALGVDVTEIINQEG